MIEEILGETSDAIAAHLRIGAVSIDIVHKAVAALMERLFDKDHAIGANAEMAVAEMPYGVCIQMEIAFPIVDQNYLTPNEGYLDNREGVFPRGSITFPSPVAGIFIAQCNESEHFFD